MKRLPPHSLHLQTRLLRSRLLALPGVLTFLSVLAVLLGTQPPAHDTQPRFTAGSVTPALPELRAAPQPAPVVPLLAAPPPEVFRTLPRLSGVQRKLPRWDAPPWTPDLHALGRQQTDGG
ncbi:hypothetical protein ACFSR9_14835 [Deinococcus taklimakanensis]|uniref:Uncharacterized protein n=1 Tax=Deinococcus taklimakanensis TaxID=536443 RepID=A0ABW5P732_9DEIO